MSSSQFFHRVDYLGHTHQIPNDDSIIWFKFRFQGYLHTHPTDPRSPFDTNDPRPFCVISPIPMTQSPHYIDSNRFFQEGRDFLRTHLSNPYLFGEELDQMIEIAMCDIRELSDQLSRIIDPRFEVPNVVEFGVVFEVNPQNLVEIEQINMEEPSIRSIPASHEAIRALKKCDVNASKKQYGVCSICIEDFGADDDGVEVLAMPCNHVFHQPCIVSWLEINHTCPLCRCPVPSANYCEEHSNSDSAPDLDNSMNA